MAIFWVGHCVTKFRITVVIHQSVRIATASRRLFVNIFHHHSPYTVPTSLLTFNRFLYTFLEMVTARGVSNIQRAVSERRRSVPVSDVAVLSCPFSHSALQT